MNILGQGPKWPNVLVVELKVPKFIIKDVKAWDFSGPRDVQEEYLSDDLLVEGDGPLIWVSHHGEAQQMVESPGEPGTIDWLGG